MNLSVNKIRFPERITRSDKLGDYAKQHEHKNNRSIETFTVTVLPVGETVKETVRTGILFYV